jgi:hypothetical protein
VVQQLDSEQINRLWQHAMHSQNRFDSRLNFFLIFESVLIGVIGMLYSHSSYAKLVLIAMICLGVLLTAIWGYVQARERYLLDDLETRLKEVAPEYLETVARRESMNWPLHSTPLLPYGVPSLVGLLWISLLIFVLTT